MGNKSLNNIVLCLILGMYLTLPVVAEDEIEYEMGISRYSCINAKGDVLAASVGLTLKDRILEAKPILIKLDKKLSLRNYQTLDYWEFDMF